MGYKERYSCWQASWCWRTPTPGSALHPHAAEPRLVLGFDASIWPEQSWTIWVLAVVGVVVGFLNVTSEEAKTFLLAAIGLSLSARVLETLPYIGETATSIIANVMAFIAAAMLVVAIKVLVETAKE